MGSTFSGIPQDGGAVKKQDFHPTHHDIRTVRCFMRRYLPAELVEIVLDYACYWSFVRLRTTYDGRYLSLNASWSIDKDGALCVLLSPKLTALTASDSVQVRRVSFKIASHDQGWSPFVEQRSMYEDSFTWFEAIIVRDCVEDVTDNQNKDDSQRVFQRSDDNALRSDIGAAVIARIHDRMARASSNVQDELGVELSDAWHIQTNIRGSRHTAVHIVSWEREPDSAVDEIEHYKRTGSALGRGFITELQSEDRIAVVARAKYPGWVNHIGSVTLEIYYIV